MIDLAALFQAHLLLARVLANGHYDTVSDTLMVYAYQRWSRSEARGVVTFCEYVEMVVQ